MRLVPRTRRTWSVRAAIIAARAFTIGVGARTRRAAARYDRAMAVDTDLLELAAAWRPQRPGRSAPRDIVDALVEPDWDGIAAAAVLAVDEAVLVRDGEAITVPAELPAALVAAFTAVDAIVEGRITTTALRSSEGAFPATPTIERPPILVPRAIRSSVTDDPFVHARDHGGREAEAAPGVIRGARAGRAPRVRRHGPACASTARRSTTSRSSSGSGCSTASSRPRSSCG